ncbi:hypothetical protein N656DRAFT_799380 [Canariomyces notabilis]|uniref:Uncharacterized protein n=1 Tax=Canariomyces notabilis TaxID=2074819 RepID=A0AAN6QKL5_9PEZI|nr:hypothetical protein N656DRAFT_799380 [Canariomyces arenarius]
MRPSTLFLFPALAALAAAQTNTQTVTATATQTGSVMTIQSTIQSLTTVYPTTAQTAQTTVTATGQTATVVPTAGANLLSIEAPVVGMMVGCALGMALL